MSKLQGKVAVVTGGSRGIGAGIVRALLDEGASVAFNGRTPEKGEALMAELALPDRTWFCAGSVTETEDIHAVVDGAVERFGKLDILVNNAGGSDALQPVAELDEAAWEADLRFNLTSTFLAAKRALKYMLPAGYGTIVNISSIEGKQGQSVMAAYCACKHGINGFTKAVASEVGRSGVTVNAICPGLILTDAVTGGGPALAETMGMTFDEMVNDVFKAKTMTGELNTVEQIGEMTVFLASPAGRGITGQQLSVDCGLASY
ncbi:MAG: 3-oxoacyl-ACP reductase [Gammaproteobacteria bacterium]|nr:3-oxoacyl-ACP reductase [Gammaproteobacteria bacterium]|tara:strand:- start:12775 stop:13557 length:783 start_codon:yes stop_codon:yes gene_type:complete